MTIMALQRARAELARCHIESVRHPNIQIAVLLDNAEIESVTHALDLLLEKGEEIPPGVDPARYTRRPLPDEQDAVRSGPGLRTWEECSHEELDPDAHDPQFGLGPA